MNDIAKAVSKQLNLYVPCIADKSFKVKRVIPEGRAGFGRGRTEHLPHVLVVRYDLHAAAAAARRRFHHNGKANPLRQRRRLIVGMDFFRTWKKGDAALAAENPGLELVTH